MARELCVAVASLAHTKERIDIKRSVPISYLRSSSNTGTYLYAPRISVVLEAKMLFATGSGFGNGVVAGADEIYAHLKFHVISPQLEFLEKQGDAFMCTRFHKNFSA